MKTNKFFILTIALLSVLSVSACGNTWHGAGQDVENVGEEMQDSSGK